MAFMFVEAAFSMLGAAINAIRQGEKVGTISNLDLNLADKERMISGTTYYRIENPFALCGNGGIFAGVMRVRRPNGMCELAIVTDGLFNGLSPMTKVFLISHEEGHIHNGDITQYPTPTGDKGYSVEREKKADLFAAKRVGKRTSLAALKEVERIVRLIPSKRRAQRLSDLNKRILALSEAAV